MNLILTLSQLIDRLGVFLLLMPSICLLFACGSSDTDQQVNVAPESDPLVEILKEDKKLLEAAYKAHFASFDSLKEAYKDAGDPSFEQEIAAYDRNTLSRKLSLTMEETIDFRHFFPIQYPKKTYGFDPLELTHALEFKLDILPVNGEDKGRFRVLELTNSPHATEDFFQVLTRNTTGEWSSELMARGGHDKRIEVIYFLEHINMFTHFRIETNTFLQYPEMVSESNFNKGKMENRFHFYDVQNRTVVGHYYVHAFNENAYYHTSGDPVDIMMQDLNTEMVSNNLEAEAELTPKLNQSWGQE